VTADHSLRRSTGVPRTDEDRVADHAAIERLADDLVPALIAKLSASGLGEIEVGEDDWTVRVRRPAEGAGRHSRRQADRASRSQPGHAGHGHGPAAFEGHRTARDARPAAGGGTISSNGASAGDSAGDAGMTKQRSSDGGSDPHRVVATSPAVGVFQPRSELTPGTRVRGGDRLGAVDMLGIPQEVVAPADGILGACLVEAGQAVEYGQELIIIELVGRATERVEG
jgi:biotin carboxyl carrier protein